MFNVFFLEEYVFSIDYGGVVGRQYLKKSWNLFIGHQNKTISMAIDVWAQFLPCYYIHMGPYTYFTETKSIMRNQHQWPWGMYTNRYVPIYKVNVIELFFYILKNGSHRLPLYGIVFSMVLMVALMKELLIFYYS
jgi:hypothetical protein